MSEFIQYKTCANRNEFRTWRNNLHTAGAYCVTITENNESFSFSINVSKPIQQAGVNDLIVYNYTDGCFKAYPQSILKVPKTSDNLTGKYCQLSEVYTTELTNCDIIGTVISKEGSKLKIAAIHNMASKPWYGTSEAYSLELAGVHTSASLRNGQGGSYWTGAWNWFLTNHYYSDNPDYVKYWIGIKKTDWDAAVAAHKAGTGDGTVTSVGQVSGTFYVQDYNYDYDLWYTRNLCARFPGLPTDANAVLNGHDQTRKIVDALEAQASIEKTSTDLAAGYCFNYAAGTVPGFGAGSWWLPTIEEAVNINKAKAEIGSGYNYLWTCVQYSATYAWSVINYGYVDYSSKYIGYHAVPVSALDLANL